MRSGMQNVAGLGALSLLLVAAVSQAQPRGADSSTNTGTSPATSPTDVSRSNTAAPAGDTGNLLDTTGPSSPSVSTTLQLPRDGVVRSNSPRFDPKKPNRDQNSNVEASPSTAGSPRLEVRSVPRTPTSRGRMAPPKSALANNPLADQADAFLTQKIRADLLSRDPAAIRGVSVTTVNGVVYLRGQVPTAADRDMVYGITRGHAETLPVRNELSVRR